jgi:glutamate-1-semialdehyde aminotransferase
MLRHLVRRSRTIYPRLASMGTSLRSGVEAAFRAEGIEARCTGGGNDVVPAGSLFMVNFPRTDRPFTTARDVWDPRLVDIRLREDVLKLALMTLDVHVVHGGGAVSAAHEDADIERTIEAYGEVARLFKRFGVS